MELPTVALAVFQATALLSLGLLAFALVADLVTSSPAQENGSRQRRILAAGWTAAPLLMLAALLAAVSGVSFGL